MIPFAYWKSATTIGWAWMNSYKDEYLAGAYGTTGIGSISNRPGARWYAGRWREPVTGNLWVYGGWGVDVQGDAGFLSDLWKYEISTGKWTFVKGNNSRNIPGTCGTKGTASATNLPGGKEDPFTWIDSSGNLWMFGGVGGDCAGSGWEYTNELWKYDVSTGNWTWMSGATGSPTGTYGTKGTGSNGNTPGGRLGGSGYSGSADSSGNLWLFGGSGYDSSTGVTYLNDLWKYEISTGKWTWVSGSNTGNQNGTYGTKGTGATTNIPGGRNDATGWIDPLGGFIWIFGGNAYDSAGTFDMCNDLWKYEISTGKWTWISGAKTARQSGTWGTKGVASTSNTPGATTMSRFVADSSGNAWLVAGYAYDSTGNSGEMNTVWRYRPGTNDWTWMSGSNMRSQPGVYGTLGVTSASNTTGGRSNGLVWIDFSDMIWIFSGVGWDSTGNQFRTYLTDVWNYSTGTQQWTWMGGPSAYYQMIFQGHATIPNSPGARRSAVSLTDSSGNFWLFGGYGTIDRGNEPYGEKGDLWKYNSTAGTWTYLVGNLANYAVAPTYGTKGTGSTGNLLGARRNASGWADSSGNLWFFGGTGYDKNTSENILNDLWRYEISTGKWTWMTGSNTGNAKGIYGTKGTAAATNTPGARDAAASTTDSSGNLWLFAGGGRDSTTSGAGFLNDLWKYNITSGQWTWVAGANTANGAGTYGTKGTGAAGNVPGSRNGAFLAADASGNIWMFGGAGNDCCGGGDVLNDLWKYDVTTGYWTWMTGSKNAGAAGTYGTKGVPSGTTTPGARYNFAAWMDSSGALWVFGGDGYAQISGVPGMVELSDLWKYDPTTNRWTWVDGPNVSDQPGSYNLPVGTINANNIPASREGPAYWKDSSGNFWLYGGWGWGANGLFGIRNDFWKYKPQ